jgi:hypothetical protein
MDRNRDRQMRKEGRETEREKERNILRIYFKELAHVIGGSGKSKIFRVEGGLEVPRKLMLQLKSEVVSVTRILSSQEEKTSAD